MELNSPPAELILSHSQSTLGYLHLDGNPQPGAHLDFEGQTYLVLERRHRYSLKAGRYWLHQIILFVQKSHTTTDRQLFEGQWVIGDITCVYNARSELLRCAVNPHGPCDRCSHYQCSAPFF